jgi:hypothetical protein
MAETCAAADHPDPENTTSKNNGTVSIMKTLWKDSNKKLKTCGSKIGIKIQGKPLNRKIGN